MSRISCKHCTRSTLSSLDFARLAGWRLFTGVSQTGKKLDDVVCPTCAGTTPVPDAAMSSWSVRCKTCDWQFEDEWDEGPLTAKDAKNLARDHECEPWVEVAPPGADPQWMSPRWVNDDGSLVDDPRMAKALGGVS